MGWCSFSEELDLIGNNIEKCFKLGFKTKNTQQSKKVLN